MNRQGPWRERAEDCTCGWSPPIYPVRDWEIDTPDDDCPEHGEVAA